MYLGCFGGWESNAVGPHGHCDIEMVYDGKAWSTVQKLALQMNQLQQY